MIADIIVISVLLISALAALLRGFVAEVMTVVRVVGALAAAYFIGPHLAPAMQNFIEGYADENGRVLGKIPFEAAGEGLAYGSMFIVALIILSLLNYWLNSFVKGSGLSPVDRILGLVFGAARGALLVALVYLPVMLLVPEETQDEWFEGSVSRPYLKAGATELLAFFPDLEIDNAEDKAGTALEESGEQDDGEETFQERLEDMDLLTPEFDNEENFDIPEDTTEPSGDPVYNGLGPTDLYEGYTDETQALDQDDAQ